MFNYKLVDVHSNEVDVSSYTDLTDNSKEVKSGGIFVAVKGLTHDGHDYLKEAVTYGANLVVIDEKRKDFLHDLPDHVRVVCVPDTLLALGSIAFHLYKVPSNIVAVTGTNGKTSVVFFVQQLLTKLGVKAAAIGTLGVVANNQILDGTSLTTPSLLQMYKLLHKLKTTGIDHVAIEASSHGLFQHRLNGIPFKGGAFTSFSRDHLDYHKDMKNYLQAKLYLFESLLSSGSFALINSDMDITARIVNLKNLRVLTYGLNGNFIKILSIEYKNDCMCVKVVLEGKAYQFKCRLLGSFQVYNVLCALGIVLQLRFSINDCLPLLESITGVPGRMERVGHSKVYVDYAHTPDGLKTALMSIREHMTQSKMSSKLVVVFGCGGNRDQGKRSEMGTVAAEYADVVIITDDNPRQENPIEIRREIIKGCPGAIEISDREEAIRYAIKNFSDSYILIAGKGHEKFQIVGGEKIIFDDCEVARSFLQ